MQYRHRPNRFTHLPCARHGYTDRMGHLGNMLPRLAAARIMVGAVFIVNVMCAVQFIAAPVAFAPAYQLEGAVSAPLIRSIGVCFLMWNATYPPVIVRPQRQRTLFAVVIAQQAIGLIGESLIRATLGPELSLLSASLLRFMAFDAVGLALLICAFALSKPHNGRITPAP